MCIHLRGRFHLYKRGTTNNPDRLFDPDRILRLVQKGELMLIKVKFLKGDKPSGREYTYRSNIPVKFSDKVQINSSAKGIVTEVDVPKEEIAAFADKVKSIVGLVKESEDENEGTV